MDKNRAMSYEIYKIIHIVSLFAFIPLLVLMFFLEKNRLLQTLTGLLSVTVFVSGFGLMGKLHLMHFPLWIIIKIACWLLISALLPIFRKRTSLRFEPISLLYLLVIVSVVAVTYKL